MVYSRLEKIVSIEWFKDSSRIFLVIYISLNLLYYLLLQSLNTYFSEDQMHTFVVHFPFSFISGPFIYFYFREVITVKFQFRLSDVLHFSPFFIYVLYIASNSFTIHNLELKGDLQFARFSIASDSFLFFIRFFQVFVYFTFALILSFNRYGVAYIPDSRLIKLSPYFIFMLLVVCLVLYPQFFYVFLYYFDFQYNFMFSIASILGTMILLKIFIWKFPRLLKSLNKVLLKSQSSTGESKIEIQLSNPQIELYTRLIDDYLKSKPTRNSKFTKFQFLSDLSLPEYLVNSYFNQYLGMTFANWKTIRRIEDSVELITNGFLVNSTLEALARTVGFSSRSRFVEAFIKFKNQSPSEFHKQHFSAKIAE